MGLTPGAMNTPRAQHRSEAWCSLTGAPKCRITNVPSRCDCGVGQDDAGAYPLVLVLEKGSERCLSDPRRFMAKVGLRASIILARSSWINVFVQQDDIFPDVLRFLKRAVHCLNSARYGISSGSWEADEFCWPYARQYTLDSSEFGRLWRRQTDSEEKLAGQRNRRSLLALQGCTASGAS